MAEVCISLTVLEKVAYHIWLFQTVKQRVIDAVRTVEAYEEFAKEHGVTITNVMDTHLHADHISGGRKLAEKVGGTYWLPPKDAEEVVFSYEPLVEGSVITVGVLKL